MSLTNTKTTKHSKYGYELIEQEIMPDHAHLFISAPPTVAPVDIIRKLKSISANYIFKTFPNLKKTKFWGSGLWSRGYYVGTAGSVSSEIIQKYIQKQKKYLILRYRTSKLKAHSAPKTSIRGFLSIIL